MDNACPIKIPTVASLLRDSKTVMQFFRNRAVPSRVLRGKREQFNKTERLEAAKDKRKIYCIPTSKVRNGGCWFCSCCCCFILLLLLMMLMMLLMLLLLMLLLTFVTYAYVVTIASL